MTTVFDLGKLRPTYRGDYNAAAVYEFNDVVRGLGAVYVYTNNVAEAGFALTDATHWTLLINDGMNYRGDWIASASYVKNDVVTFGGAVYIVNANVITGGAGPASMAQYSLLAGGTRWRGAWVSNADYVPGDLTTSGLSTYRAKNVVKSTTAPSADTTNWEVAMGGSSNAVAKAGDTMTGRLVLSGGVTMDKFAIERINLVYASPTANQNVSLDSGAAHMFTGTPQYDFNFNFDCAAGFNASVGIGQVVTAVAIVTNGSSPHFLQGVTVGGTAPATLVWSGSAPNASNTVANAIDMYQFNIIKTGDNVFTVFASRTKYA
ncbi:hypothetical protein [Massilia sp. TN1-12]|uniref:hypothetical protein n=1 Tax=Massilia paldalensis TaxID=3377675 RepID=UPI00384EEA57